MRCCRICRAIEPWACIYVSPCCRIQLITKTFFKKNFFFSISPLPALYIFHVLRNGATSLPCVHSAVSTVRSDFQWCPKVIFSVIISHIYEYGYLASWNPVLIGVIFLSLALMERCKEAAFDWLSEISLSYQELVFCWILPTRLLKFEENEMLQSSQMAHVKRKGIGGHFWSGVMLSRYVGFWMEGFVSFRYICIDSLWSWKQKQPTTKYQSRAQNFLCLGKSGYSLDKV